jgi:hypothetical protein
MLRTKLLAVDRTFARVLLKAGTESGTLVVRFCRGRFSATLEESLYRQLPALFPYLCAELLADELADLARHLAGLLRERHHAELRKKLVVAEGALYPEPQTQNRELDTKLERMFAASRLRCQGGR